ncbi:MULTISPECIES: SdrD B-like domain-containing protein [unclassified Paenibacillus]|uniref:SdrD B-like domain-containing protein n=1 Tax=unclassified Paenibacillus TaxID=185978 RepID=UPI0009311C8D|nr:MULTISPECIES: SdrD B-like domain-containing protein [unclassified Paenibacillus]
MNRMSFLLMWTLLLQMILQPFALSGYAAAPTFTFTKSASKATVSIGDTFTYNLKFAVASATAVGVESIKITDVVPPQFAIMENEDSDWDSIQGQTLIREVTNPNLLKAGSSLSFSISVKADHTWVNQPVATTNTAKVEVTDEDGNTTIAQATADVVIQADPDAPPSNPGGGGDGGTVIEATYDKWEAYKTQSLGDGSVPITGGLVTYKVGIKRVLAGNTANGTLNVPFFYDNLPAQVPQAWVTWTQGSAQNAYYDPGQHRIVWEDISLSPGQKFEADVKIVYPDDYGYAYPTASPLTLTNTVTMDTYSVDGGQGSVPKTTDSVDTLLGQPVSGDPGLNKDKKFAYRSPGQKQQFTIGGVANKRTSANPKVNSPLYDVVITDPLPPQMNYESVQMPSLAWSKFLYETNNSGSWIEYTGNATAGSTVKIGQSGSGMSPAKDIILSAGEYVTKLQWKYDTLAVGKSIDGIVVAGTVLAAPHGGGAALQHGDTVTNNVYLDYQALTEASAGVWSKTAQARKTESASFRINDEKPWLIAEKSVSGSYRPLDIVPFVLTVKNDIKATGPYVNPVLYDLLPERFNYYVSANQTLDQSFELVNAPTGTSRPKAEIVTKNFNGTGRTLVKWSWDAGNPASFAPDTSFQLKYKGEVQAGTPKSSDGPVYRNDLYISTADPSAQFWHGGDKVHHDPNTFAEWMNHNTPIKDTTLQFDPTPGVDEFFVHASAVVPVKKATVVQSTKWNRGDLAPIKLNEQDGTFVGAPALSDQPFDTSDQPQYTEFPYYSVTFEGGTADYKLVIRNSGNTKLGKISVLDILPHIGDRAVRTDWGTGTAYESRGSQWRPNLSQVLSSGPQSYSYTTTETGSKTVTFNLETYYSKSIDQEQVVRFDVVDNGSAAKPGWVSQRQYNSDDLSDIRSLYFEITNINGGAGLAAGEYIVLDWKMDAPVGAPTDAIAWNSFAIQATEAGANGSEEGSKMLPTAPNKVGFIIDPADVNAPLGEIGDFVWFDSDRDGTQNESYPGDSSQKAGINGITVNLYRAGDIVPYRSSKTGYDMQGNPGYYLFQGLAAGEYEVEFMLPAHYTPTVANALGDDPDHTQNLDSNKVAKGSTAGGYTPYRTDTIKLPAAGKNRTIDLGLIEASESAGHPGAALVKKIESVEQGTAAAAPSQEYVLAGNKVRYSISFTNTSSVVLHNIRLTDELDRQQAGLAFHNLVYDGQPIPLNGNSHNRPDVITDINNAGTAPSLSVKSLDPGKTLKLEGEYTVTASDIDRTDLVNQAIVYYNESPVPLKDEASIPTAALDVKKKSSALSVSQAGAWIDYVVTIANTGSRDLHNLVITDSKVTGLAPIALLKSGETRELTYTYQVSAADLNGAKLINTVVVKPDETPTGTATHEVPVITSPRGSIGDYVWLDRDEDGVQDAGEPGINGLTVKLFTSPEGSPLAQTVTRDKDGKPGYYLFQGLPAGDYYVQFVIPADYGVTLANASGEATDSNKTDASGFTEKITIGTGSWHDLTIDLGLVPRGEIGNYVWLDLNRDGLQNEEASLGINGVEVRLYSPDRSGAPIAVTTTSNDAQGRPGYYLFDDLIAGDYYVQFVPPADYAKTLEAQGSQRGLDSNATDDEGFTAMITIGETAGWIDHTIDLGLIAKGAIGNYVWYDANGNGAQDEAQTLGRNGVTVKLYNGAKQLLGQTVTADDSSGRPGYYLFDQLLGGEYYVEFMLPSGYVATREAADGVSPELDSNKRTGGFTDLIVIGGANAWEDLSIDLGLVSEPDEGGPSGPVNPGNPGPPVTPVNPVEPGTPEPPVNPGPTPVTPVMPQPEQPVKPGPGVTEEIVTNEDTPAGGAVQVPPGSKPSIGKQPEHGQVELEDDGKWVYTPEPGYTGKDGFTIIVTDPNGNEEEILIDIDVEKIPLDRAEGEGAQQPQAVLPNVTVLPKTGEGSHLLLQLTGLGLFMLGAVLRKRRVKRT